MSSPSPRRVAVVGAGPAGLYAAEELVGQNRVEVTVDVLDRLATPYGLVRYGVAPDHPRIKSITASLRTVLGHPKVRFHGGVGLGQDVTRQELTDRYDAVVYAAGASAARSMEIPGEELLGSCSATDFVSWYSGHPDASRPLTLDTNRVAVVGAGNVALDVARILTRPVADLERTDMPEQVLDVLRASAVREVVVLARRGPQDARFAPKELRELAGLDDVDVVVEPDELTLPEGERPDRTAETNLRLLAQLAERPRRETARRIEFRFHVRPRSVIGRHQVTGLEIERSRPGRAGPPTQTGDPTVLELGAVVRAIGYRGVPLDQVPFDPVRGVVPNDKGRVLDADGSVCPGEYVTGWLKRGPSGVIGTNKLDSAETVALLLDDLTGVPQCRRHDAEPLEALLTRRGIRPVDLAGWDRIDSAEQDLGAVRGRERTKICEWPTLLRLGREPSLERRNPEDSPWPS